jgi:hypothetical protein
VSRSTPQHFRDGAVARLRLLLLDQLRDAFALLDGYADVVELDAIEEVVDIVEAKRAPAVLFEQKFKMLTRTLECVSRNVHAFFQTAVYFGSPAGVIDRGRAAGLNAPGR